MVGMAWKEYVAENLARKGWRKSTLARAAGVSRATVTVWLQGKRTAPQGETLLKVARAFGLPPSSALEAAMSDAPRALPIPADLYADLETAADVRGVSVQELVLASLRREYGTSALPAKSEQHNEPGPARRQTTRSPAAAKSPAGQSRLRPGRKSQPSESPDKSRPTLQQM